ncbi:uncharacterized protein LOC6738025 [Drosophila simulans]|uniref:GD14484 n=1 Tax=Drosophila simulans TaxID=7240 RepID=B4QJY7_DROSI|nr:uncharacterized protein LOC6738025 [Drosophila simulans]EDX10425.1 GD14484 [Drosophila simulans]KMY99551.1 uncharacterized protein Dsimw501_GD14484 [Drosophila simulans]
MWNYRQEVNLETSVKISPYCHSWPSACWFTLKGIDLWKVLVWDRSLTYRVVLTIVLLGLLWLVFKRLKRRWNDVPMSEIESLRKRVQFVTKDMAMLQEALNSTVIPKPPPPIPDSIMSNIIDNLDEPQPKENDEKLSGYKEILDPVPPEFDKTSITCALVPEENKPEPVIPDAEPEEDFVVKSRVRFALRDKGKQAKEESKPINAAKPTKNNNENNVCVENRNVRKRPSPSTSKIAWRP